MNIDTLLACPRCKNLLEKENNEYVCNTCNLLYGKEDGFLDLYYSPLPEVDSSQPYIWSDLFYFEDLLRRILKPNMVVVEICSGGNHVVPTILNRICPSVTYLSIGDYSLHLKKQQDGVPNFPINSIIGDATRLPLKNDSVDILIGHHAINDIWLSKGFQGVKESTYESMRILKSNGYLIYSHSYNAYDELRTGDISCRAVDLNTIEQLLDENWKVKQSHSGELDWIIAKKIGDNE